ncbi:MAG: HPr family phosphocarrier protein, partial [Leptolyngbya sp. SIO1D8]|nr:HPr family phosphocarrier protein [Leptolyngbya sp. SIO1D8]
MRRSIAGNLAKKFQSKITLKRGGDQANARSVIAIMGLQIANG